MLKCKRHIENKMTFHASQALKLKCPVCRTIHCVKQQKLYKIYC